MMKPFSLLLLLAALVSCATAPSLRSNAGTVAVDKLIGEWLLVSKHSESNQNLLTISFEYEGRYLAKIGCNQRTGHYRLVDGQLVFVSGDQTLLACNGYPSDTLRMAENFLNSPSLRVHQPSESELDFRAGDQTWSFTRR